MHRLAGEAGSPFGSKYGTQHADDPASQSTGHLRIRRVVHPTSWLAVYLESRFSGQIGNRSEGLPSSGL